MPEAIQLGSYLFELADRLETNAKYVQGYLEDADGPHGRTQLANAVASLQKTRREAAELERRIQTKLNTPEETPDV